MISNRNHPSIGENVTGEPVGQGGEFQFKPPQGVPGLEGLELCSGPGVLGIGQIVEGCPAL